MTAERIGQHALVMCIYVENRDAVALSYPIARRQPPLDI
jgi:hypothetical protein